MPKIQVNDISMYYETHGQGEPLVLISGFSADHSVWSRVVDALKANYQVIVFDNRGAGQTDVPLGPYSIEQMAADVDGLCQQLGIQRAHFVGSSMGGFILQTLAFRYPKRVKSAVFCGTAMNIQNSFQTYLAAQLDLIQAQAPLASLVKASLAWAFSFQFLTQPGIFDALLELNLENPYPFSIQGYKNQYQALIHFDSQHWAKKISVPSLVLAGDQDVIFIEPSVRQLATEIPNARYVCFTDCGHLPQIEYPQRFVESVGTFHHDCS